MESIKKEFYHEILTHTDLYDNIIKIILEYAAGRLSEIEDTDAKQIIQVNPACCFICLDGCSLLVNKYYFLNTDDGKTTKMHNIVKSVSGVSLVRNYLSRLIKHKINTHYPPIKHLNIIKKSNNDIKTENGYAFSFECVERYDNYVISNVYRFEKGLKFHDAAQSDNYPYLFVLCEDAKNGNHRLYILDSITLKLCEMYPISCKNCSPLICQICAVGNTLYFLCMSDKSCIRKATIEM